MHSKRCLMYFHCVQHLCVLKHSLYGNSPDETSKGQANYSLQQHTRWCQTAVPV